MVRRLSLVTFVAVLVALLAAPSLAQVGGGGAPVPRDRASEEIGAIHAEMVRRAASLGLPLTRSDSIVTPQSVGQFQYPLRSTPSELGLASAAISNHVDLSPTSGAVRDFACGSRTYDGHGGTDIFLWPYTWTSMDRRELAVVAALGGTILSKQDGKFDRQCEWTGSPPANFVVIRHDNGLVGYYWHLKRGSVTAKAVNARVAAGEFLGHVGSSGFSTGPHLHFEIRGADDKPIEPAYGGCNRRATSWTHQAATIDTAIVDIMTHSAPPSFSQCSDPPANVRNRFLPGNVVVQAVYLRDQPANGRVTMQMYDPAGRLRTSWMSPAGRSFYSASYWYSSYSLPADAPAGIWRLRATIGATSAERTFLVTGVAPAAAITLAVGSPVRTVKAGTNAVFNVTVRNSSANAAVGCRLSLDRPIRADVASLGPGSATGNRVFGVPARGQAVVKLVVKPRAGFEARAARFPVKASCVNTTSAVSNLAAGVLILSSP